MCLVGLPGFSGPTPPFESPILFSPRQSRVCGGTDDIDHGLGLGQHRYVAAVDLAGGGAHAPRCGERGNEKRGHSDTGAFIFVLAHWGFSWDAMGYGLWIVVPGGRGGEEAEEARADI